MSASGTKARDTCSRPAFAEWLNLLLVRHQVRYDLVETPFCTELTMPTSTASRTEWDMIAESRTTQAVGVEEMSGTC